MEVTRRESERLRWSLFAGYSELDPERAETMAMVASHRRYRVRTRRPTPTHYSSPCHPSLLVWPPHVYA
jgi:hypothetical protein